LEIGIICSVPLYRYAFRLSLATESNKSSWYFLFSCTYDENKTNELNFAEKIRNLEKARNSWEKNITLYGKINMVKTFGLSKLIYNASVLVITKLFIKEIEKLIFNFIWDGRIKKSTIIAERERKKGGLKTIDFNIMNKALFARSQTH